MHFLHNNVRIALLTESLQSFQLYLSLNFLNGSAVKAYGRSLQSTCLGLMLKFGFVLIFWKDYPVFESAASSFSTTHV